MLLKSVLPSGNEISHRYPHKISFFNLKLTSSKHPSIGLYNNKVIDLIKSPTTIKSPLVFR